MIHNECMNCKEFSPTPPKPVVSLPPACEFQEVLTMDLKEVKVGSFYYILHMIDAFTRFTCSVFMKEKKADTVIHHLMKNGVSNYGMMKKIWSDIGGEINNHSMRELGETLMQGRYGSRIQRLDEWIEQKKLCCGGQVSGKNNV